MRVLILLLFLSHFFSVFSQNTDTTKVKKISITVNVLDYPFALSFNALNYNFEISMSLKNKNAIHFNFGYLKSRGVIKSNGYVSFGIPPSISTRGIKTSLEGRHYLNKHKIFEPAILLFWPMIFQYKSLVQDNTGYYIAFQTKYQYTQTEREEILYSNLNNSFFNDYTVDRNMGGGYFKFGYNAIKKSGFTIDYAVGLGVVYIESSSKNKIGNDDSKDFPYNKKFDSGAGIFIDFAYTFKIGWSF